MNGRHSLITGKLKYMYINLGASGIHEVVLQMQNSVVIDNFMNAQI